MSGKLRQIKRRVKSAKNISKITRAMQMVAASKMKRAQKAALEAKPYADKIKEMTARLVSQVESPSHPLLLQYSQEESKKHLVILISTNRGLCGSLNSNLFKEFNVWLTKFLGTSQFDIVTVGQKGQTMILNTDLNLLADFSNLNNNLQSFDAILKIIKNNFTQQKHQAVWLVYNEFISALKQEPKISKVLPIDTELIGDQALPFTTQYLFEPSKDEIINKLIPYYLEVQVRNALLSAEASEHSARMVAMKNATNNAQTLTEGLTLEYNKARQQAITSELLDIVTAKTSMEER